MTLKKTYEYIEPGAKDHNTCISQTGSGLDKKQYSLQVMFRPEGKQPRLAIIFRGKRKRISLDEGLAWHPDVDVFFQEKGWMNTKFCLEWTEKSLTKFVNDEKVERHVLLLDNLEAQTQAEFREAVSKLSDIVWYAFPNATVLLKPVDAGCAQALKALIGVKHRDWLDCENNEDQWFYNEDPYTAKE